MALFLVVALWGLGLKFSSVFVKSKYYHTHTHTASDLFRSIRSSEIASTRTQLLTNITHLTLSRPLHTHISHDHTPHTYTHTSRTPITH